MYIDSHCHLDLIYSSIININNILQNATLFQISKIVQVSASLKDFKDFFPILIDTLYQTKLKKNLPELFFTFGASPNDLCEENYDFEKLFEFYKSILYKDKSTFYKDNLISYKDKSIFYKNNSISYKDKSISYKDKSLDDFIKERRLIAIGEIGLDYFHNFFEKDKQKIAFENQLQLAINLKLPVMLHIRDAFDDAIAILKNFELDNIIFHCYSGDTKTTEIILNTFDKSYFSFAGNITYKKLENLRQSLLIIPKDRILIETDSPFLAPLSKRGKENLPWFIIETYSFIANLLNIEENQLIKIINTNFNNAFKLENN